MPAADDDKLARLHQNAPRAQQRHHDPGRQVAEARDDLERAPSTTISNTNLTRNSAIPSREAH